VTASSYGDWRRRTYSVSLRYIFDLRDLRDPGLAPLDSDHAECRGNITDSGGSRFCYTLLDLSSLFIGDGTISVASYGALWHVPPQLPAV